MISKERTLFSGNYSGRSDCGCLAVPMPGLHTALPSQECSGYLKCLTVQLLTCCMYIKFICANVQEPKSFLWKNRWEWLKICEKLLQIPWYG